MRRRTAKRRRHHCRAGSTHLGRRDVLRLGLGTVALAACDDADTDGPPAVCDDPELDTLVHDIATTDRERILEITAAHLRDGRSIDDLAYAAFIAGLNASSLQTHSNHPVKAIESARVLAQSMPGPERYVALLWAVDGVAPIPDGIDNPRDTGTPIGPLDETGLPDGEKARGYLDDAMRAFDPTGTQRAIVALFRARGVEETLAALCAWGGRNYVPNGHYTIAVAQYVRMLETRDWACAEIALRHMVASLATSPEVTSNPGLWTRGEDAFQENLARRETISPVWESGMVDDSGALEFLATLRDLQLEEASAETARLLNDGLAPQSIWDATFMRAAEAIIFGGDEHAVTSTNALHDLYTRATDPDARLLLLLQAPAWATNMTGRPSLLEPYLGLDGVEPVTPPDSAEEIIEETEYTDKMAQALGWLEMGRPEQELVDAVSLEVARHHSEWHGYKVPVAQNDVVAAASPSFAPRLRAAHAVAYARAGRGRTWPRYDAALALVSELP